MAGHQRSTSWPSMAHYSNKTEVQQALHTISSLLSAPSATIEAVCDGLRRLGDVYSYINEAICLHSNQVERRNSLLEEEMERSLQVLDLCNALQESFTGLKMTVQELQMVLKRGDRDLPAAQVKAQSYARLVKKAKHHLKKAVTKSSPHHEDAWLVSLLTTARGIAVSALKSAVELLSKQMAATCSTSKWSLVTKPVQKRRVSCEEVQLQALELGIVGLESSVENLFRSLIQNRVSLLNTLSSL
ncbi:hypothetical protein BS78_07G222300 [Paspalum vaginatum]|nr:hypothetical protein BS78_07G222300 [Paspalum vaginatum]